MSRLKRGLWYTLLIGVPYAGVLWVGLYNRIEPSLGGIPFFYWFQFLWIVVTAVITAVVYLRRV